LAVPLRGVGSHPQLPLEPGWPVLHHKLLQVLAVPDPASEQAVLRISSILAFGRVLAFGRILPSAISHNHEANQ
jgi:hypothetical protein